MVRAGPLQSGVGSAVKPKIMVRVKGPSDDPSDDELLETKRSGISRSALPSDAYGSTNAPHRRGKQKDGSAAVQHTGRWTRASCP